MKKRIRRTSLRIKIGLGYLRKKIIKWNGIIRKGIKRIERWIGKINIGKSKINLRKIRGKWKSFRKIRIKRIWKWRIKWKSIRIRRTL